MRNPFRWVDGERLIVFGRGAVEDAVEALGGPGYTLLTTARAKDAAPGVVAGADGLHIVPGGHVDEIAAEMLDVKGERIVALGGGRGIDTAKGIVAAHGSGRAMAVPTTLSGAEMTGVHRHARGVEESTRRVRCAVVVFDPALAASQPVPELAASSLNALGHAVEGPCTLQANPVATLAGQEAARLPPPARARPQPGPDPPAPGAPPAGHAPPPPPP